MAKIDKKKDFDLPTFLLTKASKCPYIQSRTEKRIATDISNNKSLYDKLSLSGFRRVENWMYRPACESCNECKAYRIDTKNFKLSKSFKRVINKNNDVIYKIRPNNGLKKYYKLFLNYQKTRHKNGSMSNMSFLEFKSMIEVSPITTKIYEFKSSNNHILGIMLFDKQKDGLSAVYSFHDPNYSNKSLGNFMILKLIELTKKLKLDYLYLGYYIKNVRSMEYKIKFLPGQIYTDGKWTYLDKIIEI